MKKLAAAVVVSLFVAASNAWALSLIPKIGVDIPTSVDYDKGPDNDTKRGYNIAAELRGSISNYFVWGAGLEYNLPRGLHDVHGDTDFSFLPVYVSMLFYPFGEWDKIKPYFKASVGYSILATNDMGSDMTGGIYWGGGIGAEYHNFVGEFFVSRYSGEFKNPETVEMGYTKMGFTLGYKLDLKNIFKSSSSDETTGEEQTNE